MSFSARPRLVATAAAILVVWSALQLWLSRRGAAELHAKLVRANDLVARLHAQQPDRFKAPGPIPASPASAWIHAGLYGTVAVLMLSLVAGALILGGRRWAAPIVAVVPAAGLLAGRSDLSPIGFGWYQDVATVNAWMLAGTIVDTLTLLAVVGLLILALPTQPATGPARAALLRAVPAADLIVGWWTVHQQWHDASNRVWLAQAICFVMVAALLAECGLGPRGRLIAIAVVLPLCNTSLASDLVIPNGHIDLSSYSSHALIAIGVAAYVAGVPALTRRFPRLTQPLIHRSEPAT